VLCSEVGYGGPERLGQVVFIGQTGPHEPTKNPVTLYCIVLYSKESEIHTYTHTHTVYGGIEALLSGSAVMLWETQDANAQC